MLTSDLIDRLILLIEPLVAADARAMLELTSIKEGVAEVRAQEVHDRQAKAAREGD
jgi:hypothetical protein